MLTSEAHLNASARGGAAIAYERVAGAMAVVPGNKLPPGQVTALKAIAAATKRYDAGEKTVNIQVKAAPPVKKRVTK